MLRGARGCVRVWPWMPSLMRLCCRCPGTWCLCLASSEEPTADGLTSTSLLELAVMSHLEALNSQEQPSPEAPEGELGPGTLHAAPGSGFASEENEESKILQPPQYFWEDGGELNDSSLDLGPATGRSRFHPLLLLSAGALGSFPVSSPKALPKGNGTQVKDAWETATLQPPAEPAELESRTLFSSTLEEDEGLLPIDHLKGPELLQPSEPKDTSPEPASQEESLFSDLFSTSSVRAAVVTEAAVGIQDEDTAPLGSDLGSSMGPGVLPMSSVFSATSAARSPGVSEEPFEVTTGDMWAVEGADLEPTVTTSRTELTEPSVEPGGEEHLSREEFPETTVGWEMLEPTELPETETVISFGKHLLGMQAPSLFPSLACAVLSAGELHSLPKLSCLYALSFQVICKDWSNLAGKNYIILNMSDNIDCEEFRLERGPQLLALVEDAFSRQMDGLQERWLISLSKPNENDKHLLMTLAGEQGVIPTKDVLMALGDVKRSLAEIGIQNYSTTTSCQSHPNQPRSDYGKLFVVLVIIGSICAIIIVMGLIYNCWQRRLPKMKNMSHGEELRFVENGCHDNPTLDVASDSQSEMQEKKPSVNGGNTINGPDSWDVLINKQASEEVDVFEEDTHL
uniref:Podocalyxin like 2 n=1 Tax=Nothoprocta perdicaria TaxID=30464 RepID=A0A8C6Z314_NOTPE